MRHRSLVAPIIAVMLVSAACSSDTTEPTTADSDSTTTQAPDGTDTTDVGTTTGFAYKIAIFEDLTTDNYWAYLDPESSVWNGYVIGTHAPALFQYAQPDLALVPQLADGLPAEPVQDGDTWSVTQPLIDGVEWSDGEPVDANDIVFTYEVVRDLGLGGNWLLGYPIAAEDDPNTEVNESSLGLLSVEAVDQYTVEYVFNDRPGLSVWQFGVGLAAVLPEHFWAPRIEGITTPDDLYLLSGADSPSVDGFEFEEHEPGAFARNVRNDNYSFAGATTRLYDDGTYEFDAPGLGLTEQYYGDGSGSVNYDYTEGPYAATTTYSIYSDQNAAVLALANGEVDFMLTSLGLQRGLQQAVLAEPSLDLVVNPSNGYRYLAFNMRRWPMSDLAFRRALSCMVDKDFMANTVLAGAAQAVWSQVPAGNAFWANPDNERLCDGLTAEQRLDQAVQTLLDAGYTWDVQPQWDEDNLDVLPAGEGLRGPDGQEMPELELLAPGPGYDPLRATYALFIEDWANDLGIPVKAEPTGFNVIVDKVFSSPDADFDMYILGWTLTPFPNHLDNFFYSAGDVINGGNNTPGYADPAYDALVEQFRATTDLEEARSLVRQMDAKLAEDLPYLTLFTTPILEPYRTTLQWPFVDILDGLQTVGGVPNLVQLAN